MGFYGSVYYQLIDTFYKFIAENDGYLKTVRDFPTTPNSDIIFEANGRKSVIDLNTGNRWLSFTKGTGEDKDKVFLWHNAPDKGKMIVQTSFTGAGNAKDKTGGDSLDKATQLNYGDQFAVDSIRYDDAGHIAKQEKKYFILPQELVNFKVDALEALIFSTLGEKEKIQETIDLIKAKYPQNVNNLLEYVQYNDNNNKIYHDQYIGKWNEVFSNWQWYGAPTITEIIGNLDNLYRGTKVNGFVNGKANQGSLVDCIGDMSTIAQDYKGSEEVACSISDALHEFKKQDGIIDTINKDIETAMTRIDNTDKNLASTNIAVEGVDARLDTVETNMGSRGDYKSVYTEVGNLYKANTDEAKAREEADTALNTKIEKEISDRDTAVTAERESRVAAINILSDNLATEIQDRRDEIGRVDSILGSKGENNDSVYAEIGKLHNKDAEIVSVIGDKGQLDTIYTEIRNLQASDATITADYKAADATIVADYKAADKVVEKNYAAADEALVNTYIGVKGENHSPLYTEIDSIKTSLEELANYSDDTFETKANAKNYALQTSVEASIADINKTLTDSYLTSEAIATKYMPRNEADKFALTDSLETARKEAAQATAEVKTLLSAEIDNINNNIGKVEGEGQNTANQLSELLNRIERIEAAIIGLGGTLEETPQE